MDFITDFKAINKVVLKKSNESYLKNLLLIPMFGLYMVVYVLLTLLLNMSVGQLGGGGAFLASLITWFLSCYMISDFLSHLESAIGGFKFKLKSIGKGYMSYFMPLLTATAIPRIIVYLFSVLTGIYVPFFWIIIFYLAYATPEIVYQKNLDRLEMFAYGHRFLLENWQHWLAVNLIHGFIMIAFLKVTDIFIMKPFGDLLINLPALLAAAIYYLVLSFIIGIPLLYYLIYRGYIFKILSVSSRRKREYMRNIYGK